MKRAGYLLALLIAAPAAATLTVGGVPADNPGATNAGKWARVFTINNPPNPPVYSVEYDSINHADLEAPTDPDDDYKSSAYHPVNGWELVSRDFDGGSWYRGNIQSAGSVANRMWTLSTTVSAPWIAPRAGMLTAITVCTDGAASIGASGTYTVTLYKNGSSAGISATIAANGYKARNTLAPNSYVAFAAGDEIEIVDSKTGSVNANEAVSNWYGVWTE